MPYSALSAVERRKPSAFLKSEGSHFTPYSFGNGAAQLVQLCGVFMRAYRERGAKILHESCFASAAAAWRSRRCIAGEATCAALEYALQPLHRGIKRPGGLGSHQHLRACGKRRGRGKSRLLARRGGRIPRGVDIGAVLIHRHLKMGGTALPARRWSTARSTSAKQPGTARAVLFQHALHLYSVIFRHGLLSGGVRAVLRPPPRNKIYLPPYSAAPGCGPSAGICPRHGG